MGVEVERVRGFRRGKESPQHDLFRVRCGITVKLCMHSTNIEYMHYSAKREGKTI
jgi:hypothetical protein